uniref:Uncharacterized protein n=1 Tax=Spongospora subterranea TaxID=70186 RepID=A0A0H5QRF1_9EUKA|eukprot:CRZ04197.1 hypothetical protein [Spongospora subterranea]
MGIGFFSHIIQGVDRGDRHGRLGDIETGLGLGQDIVSHQYGHEIAALQELHHQIQVLIVLIAIRSAHRTVCFVNESTDLERVYQLNNPRIIGQHHQIPFGSNMLNLKPRSTSFGHGGTTDQHKPGSS